MKKTTIIYTVNAYRQPLLKSYLHLTLHLLTIRVIFPSCSSVIIHSAQQFLWCSAEEANVLIG